MVTPHREWAGDEKPWAPRGPALPPQDPAGASPTEAGHEDTSPAGDSPAAAGPPEKSPAETRPADVTPADARPADTGPAEAHPAEAHPDDTRPPETSPPEAAGTGQPSRVPARQGPPPKPAPGSAGPGGLPAVRPGAAPATRPAAGPPARRQAAEPSWATVLATTFRLWAGRRLAKTSWRVVLALLLAAILFGAGAGTVALIRNPPAGSPAAPGRASGTTSGAPGSAGGALAPVTAARKRAAAWVAHQVNPDEIIGCDPAMCAALEAAHIQANRLLLLGPSQQDPLGSEILMDSATLRSQFGSRLESVYAPVSLAAFGSGAARVEVRFVVPNGARKYLAELAGDWAARKAGGTEMLRNHSIHASPAARGRLTAGQVDTRLLVTLVTLAHSHPVDIISFGASQAGASAGVPVRSAEIAGAAGPGSTPAASIQTLRSFISSQQPPYRPSGIVAVKTASGQTVLRIEYPAPSLLGLLGTHGFRQGELR